MKLKSILTDDLNTCIITGTQVDVERHHVFEGRQGFKSKSEKYGFIAPLHRSIHPNGAFCSDPGWQRIDHELKRRCQEYYMKNIGTREEWYEEFGRYYDFDWEE